ncbi:MAG: hypothetical protein LBF57_02970 [Holosporaceae bacterium]|jgi:hypothetical protein|nr:hypothetical protein [Holosporaceae bacterium]
MRNIDGLYTKYHLVRMGIHCYPTEFLIRTMLGSYPKLKMAHNYNRGGQFLTGRVEMEEI